MPRLTAKKVESWQTRVDRARRTIANVRKEVVAQATDARELHADHLHALDVRLHDCDTDSRIVELRLRSLHQSVRRTERVVEA